MDEIIKEILIENKMVFHEIQYDYKMYFTFFEDGKEDYYVLLFMSYEELKILNGDSEFKFEFLINAVVEEDIRKKHLKEFDAVNLDYNLSFILILNLEEETDLILKELHKIEENYRIAKKYILPYNKEDVNNLKQKIKSRNAIVELNKIAIKNSSLLNNKKETWYKLLMSLFIKLPFLNYIPLNDNQQLKNIKNEINSELNDSEKIFVETILSNFYQNQDIEDFLLTNNLFENESRE
ncbi:hypothetical protein [Flavobacterium luteolum]|uniref:hypothetical protein n=1 Tax=Flavobacterium luteolum TaxID=3003259 RepID=UPI00248DFE3C|nr:hypothetical protein [Flavobacterium luteolum]